MNDSNLNPKLTVVIVTWNSMLYLFDCLESLMRQNFRDFSVIVIDNDSKDSTVSFVRSYYPTATVLQNFKNNGLSKANNQGIKISKSKYVLIMNPDVVLTEDYLATIVKFADNNPLAGSFGGKLLKLYSQDVDPVNGGGGLRAAIKSDIIDSAGLLIYKSRRVIDRGEGEKDKGQYQKTEQVFGLSGACVMYRREALDNIKIKNEYFDNNFFAYKEDIDIAWRLRLYGWQNWYLPIAVAYHRRYFASFKEKSFNQRLFYRQKTSKFLRSLSFRNHRLMLIKNEIQINFFYHIFLIAFRELKILIYILIFEPFMLKSIVKFFQNLPSTLIKRKIIMAQRKVDAKEIRAWFK